MEGGWKWDNNDDGTGYQFWSGGKSGTSLNSAYQNWGAKSKSSQNKPDNFGIGQNHGAIGLAGWPSGKTLLGHLLNGTIFLVQVIFTLS